MKKIPIYSYVSIGYACLLIAIMNIAFWIYLTRDKTKSFEELKQEYVSSFPEKIADARILTLICIALLGIAVFCLMKANSLLIFKPLKYVNKFFMILSSILLYWQVFSLM